MYSTFCALSSPSSPSLSPPLPLLHHLISVWRSSSLTHLLSCLHPSSSITFFTGLYAFSFFSSTTLLSLCAILLGIIIDALHMTSRPSYDCSSHSGSVFHCICVRVPTFSTYRLVAHHRGSMKFVANPIGANNNNSNSNNNSPAAVLTRPATKPPPPPVSGRAWAVPSGALSRERADFAAPPRIVRPVSMQEDDPNSYRYRSPG
jgi:hypothetical protein